MMRRLLITGGGGFVAGHVIEEAKSDWDLHVLSGKPPLVHRTVLAWHTIDMAEPNQVRAEVERIRPDIVLHAAAIADIDDCERRPDAARRINVDLTAAIAQACAALGSRLVFMSSDNVFDGRRGNYAEDDPPSPINEYARSKVAAEREAAAVPDCVIARVALVMGFGALGRGNSFLDRTREMFRRGRTVDAPPEELRTPIDVVTLRRALLELCTNDFKGVLHLAGTETVDRLRLTRRLAERLGFSPHLVRPRVSSEIAGRAPRPRDASLNCRKAQSLLATRLLGIESSIDLLLETLVGRYRTTLDES